LTGLHDQLVPSKLSSEEFWHRYFFRIHQILEEENKRKALLAGTTSDDDFTWDDEEDAASSPKTSAKAVHTEQKLKAKEEGSSRTSTPVIKQAGSQNSPTKSLQANSSREAPVSGPSSNAASPRESEESFDVVSAGLHSKDASSDDSDWE